MDRNPCKRVARVAKQRKELVLSKAPLCKGSSAAGGEGLFFAMARYCYNPSASFLGTSLYTREAQGIKAAKDPLQEGLEANPENKTPPTRGVGGILMH